MKGQPRPVYSAELKAAAERLYVEREISSAEVARQLGLKVFTVKAWLKERGVIRSMSEAAAISATKRPRGRATARLWFTSKDGTKHFAESSLEYLRMQQLDLDSSVVSWRRCNFRVPYTAPDGKVRNYIPDLIVTRIDGSITIEEVKPSAMTTDPLNQAKFSYCTRFCALKGYSFRILSELDVGYARAMAPTVTSKTDRTARDNQLRKQRRASEAPAHRTARLAKTAAYMRGFRKLQKEKQHEPRSI